MKSGEAQLLGVDRWPKRPRKQTEDFQVQSADLRGRGPSGPVSGANQERETTGFNSKTCLFARALS